MSKLNAFRAVNVNYNNNAIRIEDETFHFDGESTLLSLANGGGKSVLVQMMMASFVHKRYRDMPDRPFSGYFTSSKPTFLMNEWKLDGESGYVLTGMMVRARQKTSDIDNAEELEIINFIHEYRQPNDYDLANIPIIEVDGTVKKLKGFNATRQLFEELRKDRKREFYCYDMSQSIQQRNYFQKLKEFGIDSAEWENIIRKINLKESGLSELFKEAKDEAGLIEKWFLMAVDSKLNQQDNKVKQFQQMILKYVSQYKDNESKMEQKQTILSFMNDAAVVEAKAKEQIAADESKKEYEGKIAYLKNELTDYHRMYQEELNQIEQRLNELEKQKKELNYEELSYQIYQVKECIQKLNDKMDSDRNESERLDGMIKELKKQIDTYECANLFQKYKSGYEELQRIESRLLVAKEKDKELLPKRENLGYTLRLYYENRNNDLTNEQNEITNSLSVMRQSKKETNQQLNESRAQQVACGKEIGKSEERIRQYDMIETRFQNKYDQQLERNILGFYEEGTLEVLNQQVIKKQEQDLSVFSSMKAEKLSISDRLKEVDRNLQDQYGHNAALDGEYNKLADRLKGYEEELKERIELLRYIGLTENDKFNNKMIESEFNKKIDELTSIKNRFLRQKEQKEEERDCVKSGRVIKIPEKLEEVFQNADIHYVTGMEWLKKNGYSYEKNACLVKENPMIPYSIIMSQRDLVRLEEENINFYTSYPVPIIRREDVESVFGLVKSGVYETSQIQFFVAFNHNLLNEEKLKNLIQQIQEDIDKLEEQCVRKKEEIVFYSDTCHKIMYQNVTESSYLQLQDELSQMKNQILAAKKELERLKAEKYQFEQRLSQLETEIQQMDQVIREQKELIRAVQELQHQYDDYCKEKLQLTSLHRKDDEVKSQISHLEKVLLEQMQEEGQLEEKRRDITDRIKMCNTELNSYTEFQKGIRIDEELSVLKARYDAVTNQFGVDVKILEEQRESAFKRCNDSKEELSRAARKYEISESEYSSVDYDPYKQDQCDQRRMEYTNEKETVDQRVANYNTQIAVQSDRLQRQIAEMIQKYETEEPMLMEKIVDTQFSKRRKLLEEHIKDEEISKKQYDLLVRGYESNMTALSEFDTFVSDDSSSLEMELQKYQKASLKELSLKELGQFRGELCRDYRSQEKMIQNLRNDQSGILDGLLRKEIYRADSFKHPLETMADLLDSPQSLHQQLQIVIGSYKTLLEKLEVDLGLVVKEKEKVMEMLMDYLMEVHNNLNRIDRNSTIQVKGRAIKMVRLLLPKWEELKESYSHRLVEYMDRVTNRAMERIEENGNVEELIGAMITTKNLYDNVVGIGSIEIRLFKIEADREYQISWAEVSKNSGGEGFLSAFAVLSCLLSYMRRNESDLFLEREEGKVIIMDNPFAQTNASHLLIPLMDIAKKSNTQLICLSGLGGESIYNRFDNIYVMSLISSYLQKNLKYLKAEQVKGDAKTYSMKTSRFKVEAMEQMELLF